MVDKHRERDLITELIRGVTDEPAEYLRVPGLFRRWELADLIEAGDELRVEDAGTCEDGTALLAVYRRERRDVEEVAP